MGPNPHTCNEKPSIIASMGAESRMLAEEKFDAYSVNRQFFDVVGL